MHHIHLSTLKSTPTFQSERVDSLSYCKKGDRLELWLLVRLSIDEVRDK